MLRPASPASPGSSRQMPWWRCQQGHQKEILAGISQARASTNLARSKGTRGLLAQAQGECFLPAFPEPAIQAAPAFLTFPHPDVILATPLCRQERPGVWVAAGCANTRRGRCGRARSLHGGAAQVCAWLGRRERGGGWEKGSRLLAPEQLKIAGLSDCHRCAHSWVAPQAPCRLRGGRSSPMTSSWCWFGVCGRELARGGFKGVRAAVLTICYLYV